MVIKEDNSNQNWRRSQKTETFKLFSSYAYCLQKIDDGCWEELEGEVEKKSWNIKCFLFWYKFYHLKNVILTCITRTSLRRNALQSFSAVHFILVHKE